VASPWKALSDDSRRKILILLKKKDMIPTKIAEHFNFTLPALSSTHIEGRRFDNGKETKERTDFIH